MRYLTCTLLLLSQAILVSNLHAAVENGTVSGSNASLKELPREDAPTLAHLNPGEPVSILSRAGGWIQIRRSDQLKGWTRMSHIKLERSSWSRKASGFFSWFQRAETHTRTPSMTVGIRGISEEDLQNAVPNIPAVQAMESYVATEGQAREYAQQRDLHPRNVNFLGSGS